MFGPRGRRRGRHRERGIRRKKAKEVPLAMLPSNVEAMVTRVVGGRTLVGRLSDLGFTAGTKVRMMTTSNPGPVLVDVRDSRIALGRGAAMKVLVREE